MKILLTTPPQPAHSILPEKYRPLHKIFKYFGSNKPILGIQPPYGLMYMSAYLKKAGHEVFITDGLISNLKELMAKIEKERIDVVGISSVSWNWSEAKKLACLIRGRYPGIKVAAGGAHVNSEKGKVLDECPSIDYAFYGDSEESFAKVAADMSSDIKPELIDGFAYREGSKIVASEKNAIIKDIDGILFPDRKSLGFSNYRPSPLNYRKLPFAAVFGSRGCPYRCTFCHTDNRVRMRRAENIVEEIELLQKNYGTKEILFFDDTFTLDKKRVFRFCELLLEKGTRLSWGASARVDTVTPEMLKAMKKAGCWRLLIGIESGSQRLLDRMKKGITLPQIENTVNMIKDAHIQTLGMFMFGIPTETYGEGLETIKFMKKLKLDYINVTNLTPFPGTEVYNEVAGEAGFKGLDRMNMFNISYVPKTMSEDALRDLLRRSMREFYFRLSYVLRQIRNIRSLGDVVRYFRGFIVMLFS